MPGPTPRSSSPFTDGALKVVVALGKFDAMHLGHQALALRASEMGAPWLMSFSGMAEVLGWEKKLPVVAPCDRERVCAEWASVMCNGLAVREHRLPFAAIRRMSPEEFVLTLKDLGVEGVVAGANYRFGFKAAGDSKMLKQLGEKHGIDVAIVDLLPAEKLCGGGGGGGGGGGRGEDSSTSFSPSSPSSSSSPAVSAVDSKDLTEQVSSTRIRACLAAGDVAEVSRLLGRPHRLVLSLVDGHGSSALAASAASATLSLECARNLAPGDGTYTAGVVLVGGGGEQTKPDEFVKGDAVVEVRGGELHIQLVEGGSAAPGGFTKVAIDFKARGGGVEMSSQN